MSSPYQINQYGKKLIDAVIDHHFLSSTTYLFLGDNWNCICGKTPCHCRESMAKQFYHLMAQELAYIQFVRNNRDFFEIVFPGYLVTHGRTFFITLDKTHFSYDPCPPKTDSQYMVSMDMVELRP